MKKILLLLVAFLATTTWAFAQVNLEVTVLDSKSGEGKPDLDVQLLNTAIGLTKTAKTDAQGKARFAELSIAGQYQVKTTENSDLYESLSDFFTLRSNTDLGVTLVVSAKKDYKLEEVTIVSRGAAKINTINAEVTSTLPSEEIKALPIEGRDATRALYRLPNVTQATGFFTEAPNVSINGSNGLYTNYLIDGLDNNENFLGGQRFAMPIGFAQSISVLTNNFSSEYGNTANGVFNITTKSGSNTPTLEGVFVTRPGKALDAASAYPQRDLSGNQVKDGFQRFQGAIGAGGAIKKDKTFYYVNLEYTRDNKDNVLTSPALARATTVRGSNDFAYLSGKIDHIWTDRFKSSIRANFGLVGIERQGGGLEGGTSFPSSGNTQDRNSINIAVRNTYTGDKFASQTNIQYARFRWNYATPFNPNSPTVNVNGPNGQSVAYLGHPGYQFDNVQNTEQLQQKFTFFRDKNTIKAGFDIISTDQYLIGGGNPNGFYDVTLTQAQLNALRAANRGAGLSINDIPSNVQVNYYGVELNPQKFGKRQNNFGVYVEDLISVSSQLNVTVGLRYDYDNLSKGGGDKGDFNNIAPRLSANYKLNDRMAIRGGYGIFYDKILYAIYSDALQQNTNTSAYKAQIQDLVRLGILPANTDVNKVTYNGNFTASSPATYLNGPKAGDISNSAAQKEGSFSNERRILNPNGYQNPYSHQVSLGYQYQIDKKRLFYADLIYSASRNLAYTKDLNAPTAFPNNDPDNVKLRTQAAADSTRRQPIYSDAQGTYALVNGQKNYGAARSVSITEYAGKADYYAMNVTYQKDRGDDDFGYRFSYTLSQLKNNTEDINFKAQDANDLSKEYAVSINDRTHVLNGIFYYYPAKWFSLTAATLIQSGQPINRIPIGALYGTTDLNGDGRSFGSAYTGNSDRQPGEGRNSDRLPWSNNFDLGVQFNIPVTKGKVELRADAFNVFNTVNLSGYSNNATQSNQIQEGLASSGVLVRRNAGAPRQFQFTARYAF